jgi:hypothetical protein
MTVAIFKGRMALVFIVGTYVALGLFEEVFFFKKRRAEAKATTTTPPAVTDAPATP